MQQNQSWEVDNYSASQEILLPFREPEGSFLCLQEPATGPYPKLVEASPYPT